MIELITGLPGNGKTLFTISQVKAQAERENRVVFYHGIPDLAIDSWTKIDDPREWSKVPPGSIVVIDEAQKTFRNRSLGSLPPQFVTDLETHRHLGIDLVMITQHPSLIDPAVRRLAGRHRHMVRVWGMEASTVHRWDSVKDNCDKSRADSEKTKWAFDKSVYKLYKSAEVHTMKRSIPGRVKLLLVLPLLLAAAVWYVAHTVAKKTVAPGSGAVVATAPGALPVAPGLPSSVRGGAAVPFDALADAKQYLAMTTPRVEGLPQTAPKYDELTKPSRVPVPAMCVQIGSVREVRDGSSVNCKCYTQQGTPMGVPFNMCVEFARNGFFQDFDPERDRVASQRTEAGVSTLSERPDQSLRSGARAIDPVSDRAPVVLAFAEFPDSPRQKAGSQKTGSQVNDGPPNNRSSRAGAVQ
jgi:zona occludens toxin